MKGTNGIINRIKERRAELRLSQKEVAEICGIPQSTVGRIESESTSPNLAMLSRICDALGLNISLEENTSFLSNLIKIDPRKRAQTKKCIDIARKNPDILKMIVFGSAARNECTANSDLDLCFLMKDGYDKLKMHYSLVDFGKACNHNCDLLLWNHLKGWFQDEIVNKGVVVYDIT
ncbi:MAG: helix-turn-helix domain-containing protein [Firmicutes bacterium]|nr:helix-turn-helix domain-containing protein [Bacillota bacterium]